MKEQDMKANTTSKSNRFSALWNNKRTRSILLSAAVILVCALVYVVLLFTILKPEAEVEAPTIGNHGEQMSNGRPFVVDPVELDQIQKIEVDNEFGGFVYYRGEDKNFYFKNAEFMLYDENSDFAGEGEGTADVLSGMSMIDSLRSLVRYMLSNEEVVGYDKSNLAAYGLDGEGKAALTLTYLDDDGNEVSKTVRFGNKTVNGSGFYCMVDGREALYILTDSYVSRCLFTDVRAYFSPQVAPGIPSAEATTVTRLSIRKRGQDFLSLHQLTEEEYQDNGELFTHVFDNPKGYYPSPENLPNMLQTFTDFIGENVLEYDIARRLEDPQERDKMLSVFRLYSLMDQNNQWTYELHYEYEAYKFDITLYLSEKLEVEGKEGEEKQYIYYVYSPDFDLIAEFKADSLPWVEWDLLTFMDNHSFSVSIDNVASVEFDYESTRVKYSLQGEGQDLKVTSSAGSKVDVYGFRQLYKAILYTTMDGYADASTSSEKILSMKISLRDGTTYDYEFFGMTARKAYYSLNGSGQFYINRDYVKQIISACTAVMNGDEVVVDRKN